MSYAQVLLAGTGGDFIIMMMMMMMMMMIPTYQIWSRLPKLKATYNRTNMAIN